MSVIVVMNFGQASALFGPYKSNHACFPPLMYEGAPGTSEYILHEEFGEVEPELVEKINWDNLPRFTIGDASAYDDHYQDFLASRTPTE